MIPNILLRALMIPLCEFGAVIDKKQEILLEGHTAPVVSVFITSNGNHIISASDDNTARVWNLQSQAQEALLEFPSSLKSVIISSDSLLLVSASFEKAIRIWDILQKQQTAELKGHTGFIKSLSITNESDFIVSGSVDKDYPNMGREKVPSRSNTRGPHRSCVECPN